MLYVYNNGKDKIDILVSEKSIDMPAFKIIYKHEKSCGFITHFVSAFHMMVYGFTY